MLKKLFSLIFFISFIGTVLTLWHRPILNKLGHLMVCDQPAKPADAIVVLSGGSPARILEAVKLFKQGFAPQIILTKEAEEKYFKPLRKIGLLAEKDPAFALEVAQKSGISEDKIHVLPKYVTNTAEEAAYVGEYAKSNGIKTILLVTSTFHTGRAKMTFEHFNPEMTIISHGTKLETFAPKTWYDNRTTLRVGIFETQKLLIYHIMFKLKPLILKLKPYLQKLPIPGLQHAT